MRFSVLGTLRIHDDGTEVHLTAPRQRALLALLLVHANEVVSSDRIIDELWGEQPPASGVKTLHYHVSKLREALGGLSQLQTHAPGYVLEVGRHELDAFEFEDMAIAAKEQLATDPESAAATLRRVLELWQGQPYADFPYEGFAAGEINRLQLLRRAAIADRIDADLASGKHAELLAEIEGLVAEHPYDERFRGQLMMALYRAGRQVDALQAYQDARHQLGEELGIEPSVQLQELEEQILLQAPELASPSPQPAMFNLPHYVSSFVGRTEELAAVDSLLDDNRLVTLVGLGGIGKTRLAVAAAELRRSMGRDGVAMIDLSEQLDGAEVAPAFVSQLGIPTEAATSSEDALIAFLRRRDMLVVVDNCEQVLDSVAQLVHRLLGAARAVRVLATSVEPLGIAGEVTFRVPPLRVDDGNGASEALALFVDRATRRRRDLVVDAAFRERALRICAHLDGIPLGIELAAARLRALSIVELEEGLHHRFTLLTGGDRTALPRHQTLKATLDWSHDLLEPEEQALLAVLAVFRGTFSFGAVRAVCAGDEPALLDRLTRLCDMSLTQANADHPVRYRLLETIREFAAEKLGASGEERLVRERHAAYFDGIATRLASAMDSDRAAEVAAELAWAEKNIQAAFEWSAAEDPKLCLAIAAAMGDVWFQRGSHELARRNLETALAVGERDKPDQLLLVLQALTALAVWQGDDEEAESLAAQQRAIAEATGDTGALFRALATQATVAWGRGDNQGARQLLIEALEAAEKGSPEAFSTLARISFHSSWMGDLETAQEYADRLRAAGGESTKEAAFILDADGTILLQRGDLDEAAQKFREAGDLYRELGMLPHVQDMLQSAATSLIDAGRYDEAVPLVKEVMELSRFLHDTRYGARSVLLMGRIAAHAGDVEAASRHFSAALRMSHRSSDPAGVMFAVLAAAALAAERGEPAETMHLSGIADTIRRQLDVELPAVARRHAEEVVAVAQQALGVDAAGESWDAGQAAGYDGALALAGVVFSNRATMSASSGAGDRGGT